MQAQLAELAAYLGGAHVAGVVTLSSLAVEKHMQEARAMLGYMHTHCDLGPPRLEQLLHVPSIYAYSSFRLGRGCKPQTIFKGLDTALRVATFFKDQAATLDGMEVVEGPVHQVIQLLIKVRVAFKTRRMQTLSVSHFHALIANRRALPMRCVSIA